MKNKAYTNEKFLQTTSLGYSIDKSTVQVQLTFSKFKKVMCKISILFTFFLSFSDKLNSKTIVCMRILYVPNDCSATGHLPFLVWDGI